MHRLNGSTGQSKDLAAIITLLWYYYVYVTRLKTSIQDKGAGQQTDPHMVSQAIYAKDFPIVRNQTNNRIISIYLIDSLLKTR